MKTQDAIDYFSDGKRRGGRKKLAQQLQISQAGVSAWGENVPRLQALLLERITKGELKADDPLLMQLDNAA